MSIQRQVIHCRDGLTIDVRHERRPLCVEDADEICSAVQQCALNEWPTRAELGLVDDTPSLDQASSQTVDDFDDEAPF